MERRLELIGEMTPAIWIHLIAVLCALVIGALVLWRRKGDARHRFWGRVWVGLMVVGAISSFWIMEIREGYSPIHLLSAYTLWSVSYAIYAIRNRATVKNAVLKHQRSMQSLYASGMLIAGGFTFLPDRLLGRLTFGESVPLLNYAIVAAMGAVAIWVSGRKLR